MKKAFFIFFIFFFSSIAFATLNREDSLTSLILANQDYCVQSYNGEKIYLKPERIHPENGLIYIDLNGSEGIVLPFLNYDTQGEYLHRLPYEFICPVCKQDKKDGVCQTEGCSNNPNTSKVSPLSQNEPKKKKK